MYGYSNPYQSFPAFSGGMPYDDNYAYPQRMPVGARRRRRFVGKRWPGDPGGPNYRMGGGIMYGDNDPYQSFPAFRGGMPYDDNYAYPQRMPGRLSGRGQVGKPYPGDPGGPRYRMGGGVMYGYSNPYQSFPAFSGGMPYDDNYAYPQRMPVSGGRGWEDGTNKK